MVTKEWIDLDGLRVLKIANHPIMSSGKWNDWTYTTEELEQGFKNTNWEDINTRYLFWDHMDKEAKNVIGKVENTRFENGTIYGDLYYTNEEAQKQLLMGAKFGISPKIAGTGDHDTMSVKGLSFKNFSTVLEPACKTTYLNSQHKGDDEGVYLIPNHFFSLNENKGDLKMTETKNSDIISNDQIKELIDKAVQAKLAESEESKKKQKEKEDDEEDMKMSSKATSRNESDFEEALAYASENEFNMKEFSAFLMETRKLTPDISCLTLAKKYKKLSDSKRLEDKFITLEKKLESFEKGDRLSSRQSMELVSTGNVDEDMRQYILKNLTPGAGLSYDAELELKAQANGKMIWELSGTSTSASSIRGTQFSTAPYPLQPIVYLRTIVDAGKEKLILEQLVDQQTVLPGSNEVVVPYRTTYLAESSWTDTGAETTAGTELTWNQINTSDGTRIKPVKYNFGVEVTNEAIRISAINSTAYVRQEMTYQYGRHVDGRISAKLLGTSTTGTATMNTVEMTNAVRGCQTLFGGSATNAANSINQGDILATTMIADGRTMLMATKGYFWSSNVLTPSALAKNPWENSADDPFVLVISPEQEGALLKDQQFVHAAQYGSREALLNGEIGKYLGVKVITTTRVPSIASSDYILVQASQVAQDTASHICGMAKWKKLGTLAYGLRPMIKVFDWPTGDKVRFALGLAHETGAIQSDALVRMVVADRDV